MNREDDLCWFHGKVPRESAEQILLKHGHGGVFLVRESNTSPGDYVLSVLHDDEVCHYQIRRHGEDAFFSIDNQTPIHGLDSLIQHYQQDAHGLVTQLSAIVKKDPPPHDTRSHGRTNLLHRATKGGDITVVSELLKCGYRNIDAKNQDGQTAVHLSCLFGVELDCIIKILIDSGANVNCRDKDGNTPLHYACQSKSAAVVKLLIDAKANIQARNNGTGCVPLHYAASEGNYDAVKQLLEMGAPHLPRASDGQLPADYARDAGHTQIVEYLENYTPAPALEYQSQWYHGTLDRSESNQILRKFAKNMYENRKSESTTAAIATSDEENGNGNDSESDLLSSGTFLIRYSKKESNLVLTLLDNDQLKNFIIRKHMKYLYIDQGPYLPSLEHLVQHYKRFSDGLPVNLRYPVPPKPKPPLPEANRHKFFNTLATDTADRNERKFSVDHLPTAAKRTQRNRSIPSDDLMNHVGILSTSPNASNIDNNNQTSPMSTNNKKSPGKSPSDNSKFRSLRLPKKNIIIDGMRSLTRSKYAKEARIKCAENANVTAAATADTASTAATTATVATAAAAGTDDTEHASNLQTAEDISQSLRNLTFSADFKPSDILYNVPTNNCAVTVDDVENKTGSGKADITIFNNDMSVNDDDLFIQSDQLNAHTNINTYDKDNSVEEIYFVDAPTKTVRIQSFNYVAFKQVPYFPDGTPYTCAERATVSNCTPISDLRSENVHSIISSTSNESEFMLSLQLGTNQDSTNMMRSQTQRPNYYIPKSSIILNEVLGSGEFASVYKGIMKFEPLNTGVQGPTEISVAIKTLHDEHCKENRAEFLREASVMIKLSHHCIVKLIGISKGPPLMIVQELVGLGSLLNYLLENSQTINPNSELKIWASQIACGMHYLESQHFVHRDLAARNILLASKHQAKISDFGLSRALCVDDNYYQASQGGKWPIKWYAPESFNFGTFSHASDVWSFGVTLWEMFSFGQAPYGDMKGVDVIKNVENGKRLKKPDACPENVFRKMENCWNYSPRDRPTFRHLTEFFSNDPDYQNLVELIKTQNIQ